MYNACVSIDIDPWQKSIMDNNVFWDKDIMVVEPLKEIV